jgi:hypothetical protein
MLTHPEEAGGGRGAAGTRRKGGRPPEKRGIRLQTSEWSEELESDGWFGQLPFQADRAKHMSGVQARMLPSYWFEFKK